MPYRTNSLRRTAATAQRDRCPRCNGNMIRHGDQYGMYASCLQCGKIVEVERPRPHSRAAELAAWRDDDGPAIDPE